MNPEPSGDFTGFTRDTPRGFGMRQRKGDGGLFGTEGVTFGRRFFGFVVIEEIITIILRLKEMLIFLKRII